MNDSNSQTKVPDLSRHHLTFTSFQHSLKGSYSSVYQGIWKGTFVAIKVISNVTPSSVLKEKFQQEGATWATLHHPNILPLLLFIEDEDMFRPFGAFVSPWCRYRSSEDYLTERKDSISLRDRLNLLLGTAWGVQYLHTHEPPLIHGDIKPSNILIADGGVPKICDFGFARVLLENESSFFTVISSDWTGKRYLAPEIIEEDDTTVQTVETDIYAVGCVGSRFIFDKIPYANLHSNSWGQIFMVLQGGRPPATFPDSMDTPKDEIARIIQLTWARAPWDRPTVQEFVRRLDAVVVQHEEH